MDALGFGCILPTAGRIGDFHPLERVPTGHTEKLHENAPVFMEQLLYMIHFACLFNQ
jgi:hypothetical protein